MKKITQLQAQAQLETAIENYYFALIKNKQNIYYEDIEKDILLIKNKTIEEITKSFKKLLTTKQ
jgi:hypothetical protein